MKTFSLNCVELLDYQPNRYPFLMIDHVTKVKPGKFAEGFKNFSIIELAKITQSIFPNCKIIIDDKVVDQRDYRVSSKKIKNAINFEASKTVIDALNEFKKIFKEEKISSVYQKKFSNFATLSNEKL